MRKSLRTSALAVLETLKISWPTMIDGFKGRTDPAPHDQRLFHWSRAVLEHAQVSVHVEGRDNMQAGTAYVIMSNHLSHFDIPVLFQTLGSDIRMVGKKELFQIPIYGRALRASGFVMVDRKNRGAAIKSLNDAGALLRSGRSLYVAPEGTRSKTGQLGALKKGGFMLAIAEQRPILPVRIEGTRSILAPGDMRVRLGAQVTVHIGKPIEVKSCANEIECKAEAHRLMNAVNEFLGAKP